MYIDIDIFQILLDYNKKKNIYFYQLSKEAVRVKPGACADLNSISVFCPVSRSIVNTHVMD